MTDGQNEFEMAIQVIQESIERWQLTRVEYSNKHGDPMVALHKPGIARALFRVQLNPKRGSIPIYIERETIVTNYDIEARFLEAIFDLNDTSSWMYIAPDQIERFITRVDLLFELQMRSERSRFIPLGNRSLKSSVLRVGIGTYRDGTHNIKLRRDCITFYGAKCFICGFDFSEKYGTLGEGFVQVHHLELKEIRKGKHISPIEDVRPVCSNCHSMLHQRKPPYSIRELQEKIKNS